MNQVSVGQATDLFTLIQDQSELLDVTATTSELDDLAKFVYWAELRPEKYLDFEHGERSTQVVDDMFGWRYHMASVAFWRVMTRHSEILVAA